MLVAEYRKAQGLGVYIAMYPKISVTCKLHSMLDGWVVSKIRDDIDFAVLKDHASVLYMPGKCNVFVTRERLSLEELQDLVNEALE